MPLDIISIAPISGSPPFVLSSHFGPEDGEPLAALVTPRDLEEGVTLGEELDVCQSTGSHLDRQHLPGARHLLSNQSHLDRWTIGMSGMRIMWEFMRRVIETRIDGGGGRN